MCKIWNDLGNKFWKPLPTSIKCMVRTDFSDNENFNMSHGEVSYYPWES